MARKDRKRKIPAQLLAVRRADREIERETLGDGFKCHDRAVRNAKAYTRKEKHRKRF